MDRNDKELLVGMATFCAYVAVTALVLLWLGVIPGLAFIAVTMSIAALGFYGSLLEDEKKKRDTQPF